MNFTGINTIDELIKRATELSEEDLDLFREYKDFIVSIDPKGANRTKSTQQEIQIPESSGNRLFGMLVHMKILQPASVDSTLGPLWKDIYWSSTKRPYYLADVNKLNELQFLL